MAPVLQAETAAERLPDHTQLPDSDGAIVENFQEHPQSILLTDAIVPVLRRLHPDDHFAIGQNSGIYWELTEPVLDGCKAPDWFYVPGVPPKLKGRIRRSYVMWQEKVSPYLLLEFASGDGTEERDRTPRKGKFWVYEQAVRPEFYGIFIFETSVLEMYRRVSGKFVRQEPNLRGHYEISRMGVELGLWHGTYAASEMTWMRFFDNEGRLLPIGHEQAEAERERAEIERKRAEAERKRAEAERKRAEAEGKRAEAEQTQAKAERERADRLAAKLKELGVEPE